MRTRDEPNLKPPTRIERRIGYCVDKIEFWSHSHTPKHRCDMDPACHFLLWFHFTMLYKRSYVFLRTFRRCFKQDIKRFLFFQVSNQWKLSHSSNGLESLTIWTSQTGIITYPHISSKSEFAIPFSSEKLTWLIRSFAAEDTMGFEGNFKSTCTILQFIHHNKKQSWDIRQISLDLKGVIEDFWNNLVVWDSFHLRPPCSVMKHGNNDGLHSTPSICVWMFLCLKRRVSIKKLITEDPKAPNIDTCIVFHTLHCSSKLT